MGKLALLDKKRNIAIITFQNAINYGAVLQSFALQKFLQSNGYACDILDYHCEKMDKSYRVFQAYDHTLKGIAYAFIKAPFFLAKKLRFLQFKKDNLKLSNSRYDKNNIGLVNDKYDIFIAGSDQIWNLRLTGLDRSYLLDFADKDKICISYAASLGGACLNNFEIRTFQEELPKFHMISVRENDSEIELKQICNLQICKVLDPVFLLPEQTWRKFTRNKSNEKYILVYCLHEKTVYSIAEKLSGITGYQIYCLQNNLKSYINARYDRTAGIEEFLTYMANAEYIITDSFHGASFGIIFRKNVKVVLKNDYRELNARMTSLIEEFGLEDMVINDETPEEDLLEEIDYKKSELLINHAIERSKKFLISSLGEENESRQ